MKKAIYPILVLLSLLLWQGCSGSDEAEDEPIVMPIVLYVAVGDGGPVGRAPGDPGIPQNFQLPRYLYAYFVQKLSSAPGGQATYNMDVMREELDPKLWKKVSDPNIEGLYAYAGNLSMLLSKEDILATNPAGTETEESRVYAITSYEPLTFDAPASYAAVPDLQLDLTKNAPNLDLLNIYANPLGDPNRKNGAVSKKGKFLYETKITCYHVAARIDIQWDINPALHDTYKLKTLKVNDVPQKGYFFKHTENVATPGNTLTFTASPGNQWYGRNVFYAFDKKKVECTYILNKKGEPGGTISIPKTYDTPSPDSASKVYSSWYRINAQLGY